MGTIPTPPASLSRGRLGGETLATRAASTSPTPAPGRRQAKARKANQPAAPPRRGRAAAASSTRRASGGRHGRWRIRALRRIGAIGSQAWRCREGRARSCSGVAGGVASGENSGGGVAYSEAVDTGVQRRAVKRWRVGVGSGAAVAAMMRPSRPADTRQPELLPWRAYSDPRRRATPRDPFGAATASRAFGLGAASIETCLIWGIRAQIRPLAGLVGVGGGSFFMEGLGGSGGGM